LGTPHPSKGVLVVSFFKRIRPGKAAEPFITVVSGLPRSGTSMMMKMLDAGGIPPITDGLRVADVDNPKGYYEFERVKKLPQGDVAWLPEARGKSVKVISALLKHLPPGYEYRIIFMRRTIEEVLASQKKMLVNRGEATDSVSDEELAALYRQHVGHVDAWIESQPNVSLLNVSYNDLVANPAGLIGEINGFLSNRLDASRMIQVVDQTLYRNRQPQP
jgi:hypothetical protein